MRLQVHSASADTAVIGAGPAGVEIARALAVRGLRVVCVDPSPRSAWPNHSGAWEDTLRGDVAVAHRWARPTVHAAGDRMTLSRAYVSIDNGGLQRSLWAQAEAHGARFVQGTVRVLAHHHTGVELIGEDGGRVRASVVVDASGGGTRFVSRAGAASAWQLAWGMEAIVEAHPWRRDEMVLMDLDHAHLEGAEKASPSFLYAMPFAHDRVFVEETWLATRGQNDVASLQGRLQRRLARLGVRVLGVRRVERCRIPLDLPPPRPQPVVAFGAAAGMVHPISGYMLARVLSQAGPVADALVEGLGRGGPREASRRAWRAVLPPSRLARSLVALGLDTLIDLDAAQMSAFFATFFTMGERHARALLDPLARPGRLFQAMSALFAAAPSGVRRQLLRSAVPRRWRNTR